MARNDSNPNDVLGSSLARGLMVLESFSPTKDNYTLAELSKLLKIPKSSLHRVVRTLSYMNYLRYDEGSKRYYLGTGVLSLGFSVLQNMELREIARPYLEQISRKFNKTANLAILDKHEMVYVERVRVPGRRDFNIGVGSRIPLWDTAVGRVVMSFLKPEELTKILEALRESPEFMEKCGEDALMKDLEKVRKDGFAINDQDSRKWIRAIATPVFSSDGVEGAINIIGEAEEVTPEELRETYAPVLLEAADRLSRALGYNG